MMPRSDGFLGQPAPDPGRSGVDLEVFGAARNLPETTDQYVRLCRVFGESAPIVACARRYVWPLLKP